MKIEIMASWQKRLVKGAIVIGAAMVGGTVFAGGFVDTGWMERSLFSPTPSQLEYEQKGHITIYQGLTDVTVEKAMDDQFPRIGNMMFVGTVVTDAEGQPAIDAETGNVDVEDDGCED
ncbi:MAG TPA: hypothetical protein EYH03_05160 [Chromatiales bacterium]|nr:hypothetical protein [Chromatiales bacterium]